MREFKAQHDASTSPRLLINAETEPVLSPLAQDSTNPRLYDKAHVLHLNYRVSILSFKLGKSQIALPS